MLVLWSGVSAWAALETYNFSAEVIRIDTTVSNVTDATYSIGQTLNGTITYDLAEGGLWAEYGTYTNMVLSAWVSTGTELLGGSISNGHSSVSIFRDNVEYAEGAYDNFEAILFNQYFDSPDSPIGGTPVEGLELDRIGFGLGTFNTNVLADSSLPTALDLSDFNSWGTIVLYYENATHDEVYNIVAAVQAVPEPATAMMLFFGGGIGFIAHRLRRWANR